MCVCVVVLEALVLTQPVPPLQQPTEYFDMGIFLAFFVVVSLVCLILLIKIKLKQRRSQVSALHVGHTLSPAHSFSRSLSQTLTLVSIEMMPSVVVHGILVLIHRLPRVTARPLFCSASITPQTDPPPFHCLLLSPPPFCSTLSPPLHPSVLLLLLLFFKPSNIIVLLKLPSLSHFFGL